MGAAVRSVLRDRQQWAPRAMVSTGSAPATLAALTVLREGGTVFDAAVTASAVLTVTLPMASGPGGDAAALLHVSGEPRPLALSGLGRAPGRADTNAFTERGFVTVPTRGICSATTPALVDAWYRLHQEFGTVPLDRLLAPAIALAREGTLVTAQTSRWIRDNLAVLTQPEVSEVYAPFADDTAIGSRMPNPGLARLYETIASPGMEASRFRKLLSERVSSLSDQTQGLFSPKDCLEDQAELGPALTCAIGGWDVSTTGPPTQGPLLLQNLSLYERRAHGASPDSAEGIHLLSEIFNQTYGWRLGNLTDPRTAPVSSPLSPQVLDELDRGVNPSERSATAYAGHYSEGDTTHFALADEHGNAVSWIQSLGLGFGSGVAVPEWGLLLSNRLGRSATLEPEHVNRCEPGKRPVNTIFPWTVGTDAGVRWLGGTPGGDSQCQWNTQALGALLLHGQAPPRALEQLRWTYLPGSDKMEAAQPQHLQVDDTLLEEVRGALHARGHSTVLRKSVGGALRLVGRGEGFLYGLDDGRQEGLTAGF